MLDVTLENMRSSQLSLDGFLQMYQGNYQVAISSFTQALEIIPNSYLALQGRAICKGMLMNVTLPKDRRSLLESILSDLTTAVDSVQGVLEQSPQ